jgi:Malonyl-CoA decarboxylase C-terminal domain
VQERIVELEHHATERLAGEDTVAGHFVEGTDQHVADFVEVLDGLGAVDDPQTVMDLLLGADVDENLRDDVIFVRMVALAGPEMVGVSRESLQRLQTRCEDALNSTPNPNVDLNRSGLIHVVPRLATVLDAALAGCGASIGIPFLLKFRRKVLSFHARPAPQLDLALDDVENRLQNVRTVLKHTAQRWCDTAMLVARRVRFDSTPDYELDAIRRADSVHPVEPFDPTFRGRFENGKACFALYHQLWMPSAPNQVSGTSRDGLPLLNVMAAFSSSIPASMADIDKTSLEDEAAVVCFYSINAMEQGVQGLRLGQTLLHKAIALCAQEMTRDGDGLTFVTLSPLPGFSRWLGKLDDSSAAVQKLRHTLVDDGWWKDSELSESVRPALLALAERYVQTKAADPVANFHLGNGARLHQLNWLADRSPIRMKQSFGIMANYRYEPKVLAARAAAFRLQQQVSAKL